MDMRDILGKLDTIADSRLTINRSKQQLTEGWQDYDTDGVDSADVDVSAYDDSTDDFELPSDSEFADIDSDDIDSDDIDSDDIDLGDIDLDDEEDEFDPYREPEDPLYDSTDADYLEDEINTNKLDHRGLPAVGHPDYEKFKEYEEKLMQSSKAANDMYARLPKTQAKSEDARGDMRAGMKTEEALGECGMDGIASVSSMSAIAPDAAKQQDSVSMTMNVNGQGAGGIRDILNILRDLDGSGGSSVPAIQGAGGPTDFDNGMEMPFNITKIGPDTTTVTPKQEEFGNSADGDSGSKYYGVDAVTASGDDMHRSGQVGRGVNPRLSNVSEAIADRLKAHYHRVKNVNNK
jgi:hypothetical protein